MLSWIFQMSVISLILIILVHYLFTFFKTNLTIPKVKDLVNKPQEQYEMLFNTIKSNSIAKNSIGSDKQSNEGTRAINNTEMKNELKNYLKELSNSKTINSNSNSGLGSGPEPGPMGKMNIDSGGILTSDNLMSSSNFGSSNYSTF
jgi:type II secretory pathway component PulC